MYFHVHRNLYGVHDLEIPKLFAPSEISLGYSTVCLCVKNSNAAFVRACNTEGL